MLEINGNQYKIPFKQLAWRDNVTDLGKEKGMIHFIGDFDIHDTFARYHVSNHSGLEVKGKIMAHYTKGNEVKLGEYDTVDEAKNACQLHFQKLVLDTFFLGK